MHAARPTKTMFIVDSCCPSSSRALRDFLYEKSLKDVDAANRNARAQVRLMEQRAASRPATVTESPLIAASDADARFASGGARRDRYDRAARVAVELAAREPAVVRQPAPAPAPPPAPTADLLDLEPPRAADPVVELLIRNEQAIMERGAARAEASRVLFGVENQAEVDAKLKKAGVSPDDITAEMQRCSGALGTL